MRRHYYGVNPTHSFVTTTPIFIVFRTYREKASGTIESTATIGRNFVIFVRIRLINSRLSRLFKDTGVEQAT